MNAAQRVIWLARRNFVRGSFWNFASVFLVSVSALVFFMMFLYLFHSNPEFHSRYARMGWITGLMMGIILVISFVSMLVIFYLINRVRYHEIGVLRGIGARRSFIFAMLLTEILFIVFSGSLLAIIFGVLIGGFSGLDFMQIFRLPPGFSGVLAVVGTATLSLLSITIVAVLAALFPAVVITSIEPYTAIRNRE